MNNRQKAKHFKQLYERMLATKPYPVNFESHKLDHLRIKQSIPKQEVCETVFPQLLVESVTRQMVNRLSEALKDRIVVQDNEKYNTYECTLDIWVERR